MTTAMERPGSPGRVWSSMFVGENSVRFLVLVALVLMFGVATGGTSLSSANVTNILIQSAIRGVAACGQALVVVTAGLDLSVSGVVAASLMTGGSLLSSDPQYSMLGYALSPLVVIPIMLLIGTGFGLTNGYIIARFRVPALIVTLGTWQIGTGLAFQVTGSGFVDRLPDSIGHIGQGRLLSVPLPVVILAVVVAASYVLLHRTPLGSEIYAVGANPQSAFLTGVRVRRVRIAVFALAGTLYGIAAVMAMSRQLTATMAQATGLELATIAAVAIGGVSLRGGKGTIVGVLLGVLIIGVIDNGLSILGVGPAYQSILKGVIIIAAVALDGIRR